MTQPKNFDPTLRPIAARLAHDVGKYIARTARNLPLPIAALDPALLTMLLGDLYGANGERAQRPATRFHALATTLDEPRLGEARALFAALEQIESAVRAGESSAVERAVAIALRIEALLRALARDVRQVPGAARSKKGLP
jgi:hypothetical protein